MFGRKIKLRAELKGNFIHFIILNNSKRSISYRLQKYSYQSDEWHDFEHILRKSSQDLWCVLPREEGIRLGDRYRCIFDNGEEPFYTNEVEVHKTIVFPVVEVERVCNTVYLRIENYYSGPKYSIEVKKFGSSTWHHFVDFHSETLSFELPRSSMVGDSFRCVVSWEPEVATTILWFRLVEPYLTLQEILESTNITSFRYSNIDFDLLDGHSFEHYCAQLLTSCGFINVSVTKASGDKGADIIATFDGAKYAIQCKRYKDSKVGNDAVQEVFTAKTYYDCDEAAVLTNSTFTSSAEDMAIKTGVHLWDRQVLLKFNEIMRSCNDSKYDNYTDTSAPVAIPNVVKSSEPPFIVTFLKVSLLAIAITIAVIIGTLVLIFILVSCDAINSTSSSKTKDKVIEISNETDENVIEEFKVNIDSSTATSYYVSKSENEYDITKTYDDDLTTCWQDGEDGDGIGNKLVYQFDECNVTRIEIVNGNRLRGDSFYQNNRLAKVTIIFYIGNKQYEKIEYDFPDEMTDKDVIELDNFIKCDKIIIRIDDVYQGSTYSDTGVTEVSIFALADEN